MLLPNLENCTVAVIGLGYVGLPLSIAIAKCEKCLKTDKVLNRRVIGFDIDKSRIHDLKLGNDKTLEVNKKELSEVENIIFSNAKTDLENAELYILTVPTPIDKSKRPDIQPIISATKLIGEIIKKRSSSKSPIIIYESTVYPGLTEEICVPIISQISGLEYNLDANEKSFYIGYSPERINPGDKLHDISSIIKVTSGSNKQVASWIDSFYSSFIEAGTYQAKSIKVAEAAKIIENTQRDLNIALVNELAIIFNLIGIDTEDVLNAAETKWNFLSFRPGLVGGHCIGVDPYYLTYKSEELGYKPEVVLSGRRINDNMPKWLVEKVILEMSKKGMMILDAKILILGFTFKEDCPDIRNTKVIDVVNKLYQYGIKPSVIDPLINKEEVLKKYNLDIDNEINFSERYSVIIICVGHSYFKKIKYSEWVNLIDPNGIFIDLKSIIPRKLNPFRL